MNLEIVIPYYNEAHRLGVAFRLLTNEILSSSVINDYKQIRFWWSDDGSTDSSSLKLEQLIAQENHPKVLHRVIAHKVNCGKGTAVRRAISTLKEASKESSIIVFWDSDGELHPRGIVDGLHLMNTEEAHIVFGSRFSKQNSQVLNFRHYLGNKALTMFSNFFSNLNLSDVHCCARFIKSDILFKMPLSSTGFDFEAEFVALVGRLRVSGLKLMEVPIQYMPRTVQEGKKIGIAHVLPQIHQAIRCRYLQPLIHLENAKEPYALPQVTSN